MATNKTNTNPIEEIYQAILRLNPKAASQLGRDKVREYSNQIYQSAYKHNIPYQDFTAQLFQESGFNPEVITGKRNSSAGAKGIAQLMPETSNRLSVDPLDPVASIDAAASEMSRIINKNIAEGYGDSMAKAQQRYNAGGPSFKKFLKGEKQLSETHHYPKAIANHVKKGFDTPQEEYTYQGYIDPNLLNQFAATAYRSDIQVPRESTAVTNPLPLNETVKPEMNFGGTLASLAPLLNMIPGVGTPLAIGTGLVGTAIAATQTQLDPIYQPIQDNQGKHSFEKGGNLNDPPRTNISAAELKRGHKTASIAPADPVRDLLQERRYLDARAKAPEIKSTVPDPSYEEQRSWLKNYISSPRYKEMLAGELAQSGSKQNVDKLIAERRRAVSTVPIRERNDDPRGYAGTRGAYLSPTSRVREKFLDKTWKNDETRREVQIDPAARHIDPYIGIHELSHASTDGTRMMTDHSVRKIAESVNPDRTAFSEHKPTGIQFGYYDDPTEVHSRMTELKYLMHRHGIYDPGKEKMNIEHLRQVIMNPEIMRKPDVDDLLRSFDKKGDLIELMNTIAFQDDSQNNIQHMKNGGPLKLNTFAKGGNLNKISSSSVKVKANNPQQTDSVDIGNAYVDHNEVISDTAQGQYVFSDSLLNPLTKNTFAKDAEKLAKKKAKLEKQPYDKVNENTLTHIAKMENSLATLNSIARMAAEQGEQSQMPTDKPSYQWGGNTTNPLDTLPPVIQNRLDTLPLTRTVYDPRKAHRVGNPIEPPVPMNPNQILEEGINRFGLQRTNSPVQTPRNFNWTDPTSTASSASRPYSPPVTTPTTPNSTTPAKAARQATVGRKSGLHPLPYDGFVTSDFQTWANTNKNAGLKVDNHYGDKSKAVYDKHYKEYVDSKRPSLPIAPLPTVQFSPKANNPSEISQALERAFAPKEEETTPTAPATQAPPITGNPSPTRDIGDLIQLGALGGKAAMLARGYDKQPLHQLAAPISQAAFDPTRAIQESNYAFAGAQDQARNTVSRSSMMGNLQQASANQARNIGAITSQYDQMNRQGRVEYEQRKGQQQAANTQLRMQNEQIRQQDQAQFFNNIDTILSSVGNYGKARTSQGMNQAAVKLLIQAFPDIAPHFKLPT